MRRNERDYLHPISAPLPESNILNVLWGTQKTDGDLCSDYFAPKGDLSVAEHG